MIHLLGKIPPDFNLAVSGGIDSMVALDFFHRGGKKFSVVNFNHNTDYGNKAHAFLEKKCQELKIPFISKSLSRDKPPTQSTEDFWRFERYKFLNRLDNGLKPVMTIHHLDDVMEWWIFSSLHGEGKIIPYRNQNVIRPFLSTSKKSIIDWAERKSVEYLDDPSNCDEKYMRSIIRHKILPEALRVNPGLEKVLKKKVLEFR